MILIMILRVMSDVFADADMEDYGFEYSDDEPEEQDVDIENQYYNSKGKQTYKLSNFCCLVKTQSIYILAIIFFIPCSCPLCGCTSCLGAPLFAACGVVRYY